MKKVFLLLFVAVFSLSTYSCRETTKEKTEDAADSMGNDMEDAADNAGDAVDNAGDQVQDEMNGTDDMEDTTSVN